MPLIYSFVSRDSEVLAEYTPFSGNFQTVAIECLQKIKVGRRKWGLTHTG